MISRPTTTGLLTSYARTHTALAQHLRHIQLWHSIFVAVQQSASWAGSRVPLGRSWGIFWLLAPRAVAPSGVSGTPKERRVYGMRLSWFVSAISEPPEAPVLLESAFAHDLVVLFAARGHFLILNAPHINNRQQAV